MFYNNLPWWATFSVFPPINSMNPTPPLNLKSPSTSTNLYTLKSNNFYTGPSPKLEISMLPSEKEKAHPYSPDQNSFGFWDCQGSPPFTSMTVYASMHKSMLLRYWQYWCSHLTPPALTKFNVRIVLYKLCSTFSISSHKEIWNFQISC